MESAAATGARISPVVGEAVIFAGLKPTKRGDR